MLISEAGTVQFPMVRHAQEVGWTPLGPRAALEKRGGEAGTILRDELEGALRRFNPWMGEGALRSVVERLEAPRPTIEGNREMLCWLRGERSWYDENEERHERVRLVDFDSPAENALQVSWEWSVRLRGRRASRADVMFLVNGLPVAIVEHKNPKDRDAIEKGLTQLRRYEEVTPELLVSAQLFNVTHLLEYWYGVTWNLSRRFAARWKERPEESYRFAVQSFFEPREFLRTLRDWILFYVEDGETRKSVLRQHQRHAAEKIVERCADPVRRRGLIWHTQGSGKTFTLLTAARLILADPGKRFGKPTVLVVVDRTELEGQLRGWVERLLGEMQQQDIAVARAESIEDLRGLLRRDRRGLILSMIHKFEQMEKDANPRADNFVFIDEAHRSVAGDLGNYLVGALPNATVIGFTGTPIAKTEHGRGTFKIFGAGDERGYLHKYSIVESIEDGTTLRIRHTMAGSELTVPGERLDREFFDLADSEGVTDIEELNRVLDLASGLSAFLTADDRVERVAAFVADHFRANVEPLGYKAFLVGVNREACARYKRALDRRLPPEWSAPIYHESANDVVSRPLVAEYQLSGERETEARSRFRKEGENPKILIVTDKLLTGFDAPILYCMYLDKPMRDHVLLQAIARVNRPYVDGNGRSKSTGLIVDFVGVLRELKKALRFDSDDLSGAIEDLDLLRRDFEAKITRAASEWLAPDGEGGGLDEQLERIVYRRFLDEEERERFFEAYRDLENLYEILSPAPELRDWMETYKRLAGLCHAVRNAYAKTVRYDLELGNKTTQLVREAVGMAETGFAVKSVDFDLETLRELRGESGTEERKVFDLVRGLRQEVAEKPELEPVLLPLKERAEAVLDDLETRQTTSLAALERLERIAGEKEEELRAFRASGLSPRAFAVRWEFRDDAALGEAGVTGEKLGAEIEDLLTRFPNAAESAEESRHLRAALYRPLLEVAAPKRAELVARIHALLLGGDPPAPPELPAPPSPSARPDLPTESDGAY